MTLKVIAETEQLLIQSFLIRDSGSVFIAVLICYSLNSTKLLFNTKISFIMRFNPKGYLIVYFLLDLLKVSVLVIWSNCDSSKVVVL